MYNLGRTRPDFSLHTNICCFRLPLSERMADAPSKSDVEEQLRQTTDAMSARLSSLRDEVATTGTSVRDWMKENPLKSVGGMLAAGLAVGLLFGGSKKRRRRRHQQLIDQYMDALTDEVEEARSRGEEPSKALDKALRDRVPLVVYTSQPDSPSKSGFLRTLLGESFEIVLRTALSLAARDAIESVLSNVNVEEMMEEDLS